ncbi:hypothetical protein IAQ61_007683 [Plenodomus lingam]|uniref:Predicted protein n=1 Tax=Leptosphaeria maculans (strain JN3 / isolate v23.1.3 / race Av1-4-5-6-7-8) TaxID=985895 RepID=E5A4Z8_LEPMJ|nr:predicted protein [Plenodomus lingam JN3]KAH9867091.1 hypothetical protein IAQ61_007683 [Plenodomus lingam]CBX98696.1 predicted protein [Plenodomus lingam JN3]
MSTNNITRTTTPRASPSTRQPLTRTSLLNTLQTLTTQIDTILASLHRHHRTLTTSITQTQSSIAFAARFNTILPSTELAHWTAQLGTIMRAMALCTAHRVQMQQIEKTVKDSGEGRWIEDGEVGADMVDLGARWRTAARAQRVFLRRVGELEGECGLEFKEGGEGEGFVVYN